MQFTDTNLALTRDKMNPCKTKRSTFKMLANSMLGKFSQKPNYPQILYVRTKKDVEEIFSEEEIVDVLPISEDICEIQVENVDDTPKRNSNCIIGAYITAMARIKLHSHLCELQKHKFRLFYVDTDSIIFSGENNLKVPLSCSPCLGDFKHELGAHSKIKAFSCLGRKNYCISYTQGNTEKSMIKVSGLTLTSKLAAECLSADKMQNFLQDRQNNLYLETSVPQFRNFACKGEDTIIKKILNVRINNVINIQRIVRDVTEETLPYGYCE